MQRLAIPISKLLLSLSLSLITFNSAAKAASMQISSVPLGKVISLNGLKFTKIRDDSANGSQFIALQKACFPNQFNGINMQDFTTTDCACLPTPTATNYIAVGTMIDSRDGQSYEVRKFADGKCWMVDNLRYNYGKLCSSNLYSWDTAQVICPPGWRLPTGCVGGEYATLDIANGGTGIVQASCSTFSCNFWQPGNNWKGVYSGTCYGGSSPYDVGSVGLYWSATTNSTYGCDAYFFNNFVSPINSATKSYGRAVRCLKN